jgi:hypothetical protein
MPLKNVIIISHEIIPIHVGVPAEWSLNVNGAVIEGRSNHCENRKS